jgi:hypothetical protein
VARAGGAGGGARRPWLAEDLEVELGRGEQRTLRVVLRRGGWLVQPSVRGIEIHDEAGEVPVRFDPLPGAGTVALLPPGTYEVRGTSAAGERLRGTARILPDAVHEVQLHPER